MEPSPYLIRLSRIARWRLPPKEAADVISDYSEIMAIDPRLYEDQCKDYGTPKQAVKQLTTFADYGRWMAVFLVLAACLAAPAAWLLLQFPHFQFELPREALFLPLLLGVILSLVWFRYEGERSRELPIGLVPQLLLLLALGVCVMFLAGICFSPALLELSGSTASSSLEPALLAVLLIALPALDTALETSLPTLPLPQAVRLTARRAHSASTPRLFLFIAFMVMTLSVQNRVLKHSIACPGQAGIMRAGKKFLQIDRIL